MVSVFIDQPFAMRAIVGIFHAISRCASSGALAKAWRTAGSALSMSKLLPGSMPIFFNCAMIGWSVKWGGFTLRSSAAYAKKAPAGIVSTVIFGGVFISTLGSIFTCTGFAGFPHSESGVTLYPACIL